MKEQVEQISFSERVRACAIAQIQQSLWTVFNVDACSGLQAFSYSCSACRHIDSASAILP